MNWRRVFVYAVALFAAQFVIGLLEGFFVSDSVRAWTWSFFIGSAASFAISSGIFAHLAMRQLDRPIDHAMAAVALHILLSLVLIQLTAKWFNEASQLLLAIDWAILLFALLFGTAIGRHIRLSANKPADA